MIKRHSEELDGHIISQVNGRTKELDGEAVAMLDDWRGNSQYVILAADADEELKRLRAENDFLKNKVIELQGQLLDERQGYLALAGRVEQLEAARLPEKVPEPEPKPEQVPWWRRLVGKGK